MKQKIINLTPHDINIYTSDGVVNTITSSGIARAKSYTEQIGMLENIPIYRTVYGGTIGLPDPTDGVIYIVSALTAQGCKERDDVYVPADTVRDSDGCIIGCRGLAKV